MNLKSSLIKPEKAPANLLPVSTVKADADNDSSKRRLVMIVTLLVMLITSFTIFSG